jgi:hypothetical protein
MQYLVVLSSRSGPLEKEAGWVLNGVKRKGKVVSFNLYISILYTNRRDYCWIFSSTTVCNIFGASMWLKGKLLKSYFHVSQNQSMRCFQSLLVVNIFSHIIPSYSSPVSFRPM